MALLAEVLHGGLGADLIGPCSGDLGEEVIREPVGGVMGDSTTVDPAHVAGGAGGDKHVVGGQLVWRRRQVEKIALRSEHQAMFRLSIDLHLEMVRAQVALAAGAGQPGELNRRRVPRVTSSAIADGTVVVGAPNAVTACAAALGRGCALKGGQDIGGTLHAPGLILLAKGDLLRSEILVT